MSRSLGQGQGHGSKTMSVCGAGVLNFECFDLQTRVKLRNI